MSHYTRSAQTILGLCLAPMYCAGSAFANGGPPVPFYKEVLLTGDPLSWSYPLLARMYLATVAVEYPVVYFMIGRSAKAKVQLLIWVLIVNLITNPAAQLGFLFLGDPVLLGSEGLSWTVICVIELVVVAAEFYLLKWIFGRMCRRGVLDEPVTSRRTFAVALVANASSFAFGFLGFILLTS